MTRSGCCRGKVPYRSDLARALHAEAFEQKPVNICRYVFLDPRATKLYRDWERVARDGVGVLRVEAAKNPYDRTQSLPTPRPAPVANAVTAARADGLSEGRPVDRLVIAGAARQLLIEAAAAGPIFLVIDELPWIDQVSATVLAFIAHANSTSCEGEKPHSVGKVLPKRR